MQPADVLSQLYHAAGNSLARRARGDVLLVLDEIDKLCPRHRKAPLSVSVRHGRHQSLLGLFGGVTPVRFAVTNTLQQTESLAVHTDRIPIICSGAFPGLSLPGNRPLTDAALRRYGMIPEFASRLTTRLILTPRTLARTAVVHPADASADS